MGDLFKQAKIESNSTLSPQQNQLLGPLANFARGQLGQPIQGRDQLLAQLLGSHSNESQQLSQEIYNKAFIEPQMQAFRQFTQPAIASRFAGIGGSLSSRANDTIAQTLQGVQATAGGQLAQMLPQIMNYPLQQTLGQIQGLGGLQEQQWAPFNYASRFATANTVQNQQSPAGAGWGLLGSAIQAAGFAAALNGGGTINGSSSLYNNAVAQGGVQADGTIGQLRSIPGFN